MRIFKPRSAYGLITKKRQMQLTDISATGMYPLWPTCLMLSSIEPTSMKIYQIGTYPRSLISKACFMGQPLINRLMTGTYPQRWIYPTCLGSLNSTKTLAVGISKMFPIWLIFLGMRILYPKKIKATYTPTFQPIQTGNTTGLPS